MQSQRIETPDGISWYIETSEPISSTSNEAAKEYIVLIPSGEGDCHSHRAVAEILSSSGPYHVLTFDMPGFSRTTAPPEAVTGVKPPLLAQQIIGLLDTLKIQRASFFGCSSGGSATLGLCALYPSRVKCGIMHEVPLDRPDILLPMKEMGDEEITDTCRGFFANTFIEQDVNDGGKKWKGLGPEYHARLAKNYVVWVRNYVDTVELAGRELASAPENLQRRPIFWTVGSLNPGVEKEEGFWKTDFEIAKAAGLNVDRERLRCLHFPSVTVPDELAGWIKECVQSVKD